MATHRFDHLEAAAWNEVDEVTHAARNPHMPTQSTTRPIRGYGAARQASQDTAQDCTRVSGGMTDDALDLALENWARWCWQNNTIGTCESLEKGWKSPQEWYEPPPPSAPRGQIDTVSAMAVNRAWREVPEPYKRVLSDWYVLRRDARRTCSRLAIAFSAHGEYLAKAKLMCRNVLTQHEKAPRSMSQIHLIPLK